ncbi:MAG: 1-(5-phosphoribosyl)-5-((5-phosphoribosylamino)methylideneamino)imidazole-4-carboxamide isomerase [Deltaproteobacteria bacterium]|nr:1-(5-phosphoribosyl)-5-((5-phosphoribosylamino)methylideneamino)imidazole-4-carboxamide isomerase [Deltaproteobacteria bacterium]MCW5800824.1 1-(5-phosphoribosyl)-5-((5-phosphoribosylamino)methylideneamino)imidazole-4-carboxamide isomerase [Deltaproteobacteria bacterium]
MKLFPAIDLLGGRAVRLEGGARDRATVFHERPVELVAELARDGADRLHVVDLDGAFGEPRQSALVAELVRASPIPVEVGGGIRDRATAEATLALGAAYVVLGTAAVRSPALVEDLCRAFPGRVIVAVDARDGVVAIDGWTQSGGVTALELGRRAAAWGAAALLYTDVARDGLGGGPNVAATAALAGALPCEVIASGGVGSLDDLARLREAGITAVVVGRALYDRKLTLADAARVAHGTAP